MALFTFDSIEDFARAAEPLSNAGASSWYGNISYKQAVELSLKGDDSYVKLADSFMDKLDVELPETKAFHVKHSPFGGRVNMGDWLADSPTPMRRRVRSSAEINPIKIVVSTTCSAGVDGEVMTKRGAAILALLLKLQTVRPVQLYLLTELDGECGWHHQLIRIESQPLHVGIAAFGLCHVGFARQLTYTFAREKDGSRGSWPDGYSYGRKNESYTKLLRERIGLAPDDIVIGSAHIGEEKLIEQPVAWIEDQLRKLANINDD